ncbi:hypothetical protein AGLY_015409 [Aphis glycines]|uniref:Uncharacterized protein n=1 Tax=Aphis glycines TaxID=307491 RepID=A0A6G0T1T8_APHGL|nr:hypothetical protein AGLY_015409 [Aphis glycines]
MYTRAPIYTIKYLISYTDRKFGFWIGRLTIGRQAILPQLRMLLTSILNQQNFNLFKRDLTFNCIQNEFKKKNIGPGLPRRIESQSNLFLIRVLATHTGNSITYRYLNQSMINKLFIYFISFSKLVLDGEMFYSLYNGKWKWTVTQYHSFVAPLRFITYWKSQFQKSYLVNTIVNRIFISLYSTTLFCFNVIMELMVLIIKLEKNLIYFN